MKIFKLWRKSQEAQLNWIRNHKLLWITLNVIFAAVFIGYVEWKDRRDMREFEKNYTAQQD